MKLITAIVNHDDSSSVLSELTKKGFSVTKVASTGGFLLAGNVTFFIGTQDEKLEEVLSVIKENARRRTQLVPPIGGSADGGTMSIPIEVTVGGATVFITDVERFEKF